VTYLHRIAVRPELEGRGLGTSLLHAAFDWGRAMGGRSIILNVRAENHRAIGLYRRCGFTDTGTSLRVLRHREQ
jgi:ribosomal protein S18 acetylase RimI-like enzyme